MKKFLFSLLAVAIATVAFTVHAANYEINVAGVEVSTSNYNSVTGGNIKFYTPSGGTQSSPYSGYSYVQYNPSSKVLTLANVYISRTGGDNYGVHNRSMTGLTIKFVGTCRVESDQANAIHMDKNTYVEFASGSSVVFKMSAGTNDRRGVIYANNGVQARFRGPGSLEVYGNTKSGNSAKTDGFEGKGKSNSCSLYFEQDVNVYVNVSGYGIDKFGTVNVGDCDLRIAHSNINFPLYDVNSFGYSSGAKCVTPCEASFSSNYGYFYNASGYTHFTENYGVILYPSWFPDDNFRNYLLGRCSNGEEYLTPSQLQSLTSIDVSSKSISSLSGVEYLTYLTSLNCSYNQLTSLNVSGCSSMTSLNCSYNQLTSLGTLPSSLQVINCASNRLSGTLSITGRSALQTLNVGSNTGLTTLNCYSNGLTSLSVSGCTALTTLNCYSNALTSLNVSSCTALTTLDCRSNQLTSLNVSGCSALTTLDCSSNQLTSLPSSLPTSLTHLLCGGNKFTTLTITGRTNLKKLEVYNTTTLTTLNCYNNALTLVGVNGCSSMTTLNCYNNALTSLSLSGCTSLTSINCSNNALAEINYLRSSLQSLYCQNNNLTLLPDLPTSLQTLNCSNNRFRLSLNITGLSALKTLNVSGNTSLPSLQCYNNALTSLDVSGCTSMKSLYCYNNQLTSLGTLPSSLQLINCSSNRLSGTLSLTGRTALKTLNASNNTSLTTLNCYSNALTSLNVSDCSALTTLNCYSNALTELNVSGCSALTTLDCSSNQLTSLGTLPSSLQTINCSSNSLSGTLNITGRSALKTLNVGNNTSLTTLNCYSNALTSLNVNGCTALTTLNCQKNQLTSLGSLPSNLVSLYCLENKLTTLPALPSTLIILHCSKNQLTSLSVGGCTALTELCCEDNQLTALSVQDCSALGMLMIYRNQINSTEMGNLVNSLRTIPAGNTGTFYVYDQDNENEGNAITAAQINTASGKRWNLKMVKNGYFVDIVPNEAGGLLGDVDDSGKVDVTDVNIVVNIMLGKAQASDYPGNADVNNSGRVDVSDVNKIVNIMLGKE